MSGKIVLFNISNCKIVSEVEFSDNIFLFSFDGCKSGLVMSLSGQMYKFWVHTSFFGTVTLKKKFWKNFESEFTIRSVQSTSG